MSQAGIINIAGGGGSGSPIETLTGNSGGAVPPTANNINILGSGPLSVVGNPATSTLTISANGTVPLQFTEDGATVAIPSGGNLNILGGAGISTSGSGSTVTISATGAGFKWQDQGINLNPAVAENGYFVTAAITITLPAAPTIGNTIAFIVDTTSALTIQSTGTQTIRLGNVVSAAAGTAVSTRQGDSIELVYRVTDTSWIALCSNGSWSIT